MCMGEYILQNEFLLLTVCEKGAEMRSLKNKSTGYEYLWNGDPAFWGRTAPVLFPLVGNYKNKTSYYKNKSYSLGQHGFARDSVFLLKAQDKDELWFTLLSNEKTKEMYPFDFELEIGYKLYEHSVQIVWNVKNTGSSEMYFSIGAHPAFMCTLEQDSLVFDTELPLSCGTLDKDGLLSKHTKTLSPKNKTLLLTNELFSNDALILEDNQTHCVSLVRDEKKCVTVTFDAPVVGLWSPARKGAPFVCIEPWYGRTDKADFSQELTEREWSQHILPSQTFSKSYTIETF